MSTPPAIGDLPKSPERRMLEAAVVTVRADALLSAVFKPIRLVEVGTAKTLLSYGIYTMVIQPVRVRLEDHPSQRSTSFLTIWISAYLPPEPSDEDSRLVGLDLGNYLRKTFWGAALADPVGGAPISFAVTEFEMLTPLIGVNGSTRILTYQVRFETDIDPKLGDFSG